jgi:RecJ-like exonuclease
MTTTRVPCPDCCGEGTLESEVPRGKYNHSGGYWEPHYIEVPCDTCKGEGWVDPDDDDEVPPKVEGAANIKVNEPLEPQSTTYHLRQLAALTRIVNELEIENRMREAKIHKLEEMLVGERD